MSSVVNNAAEKVGNVINAASQSANSDATNQAVTPENSGWTFLSMSANIALIFLCGYLVYKIYKVIRQPAQPPG